MPSEMPLKTRADHLAGRRAAARRRAASARLRRGPRRPASTNLPPFFSSSASSSVLVFGAVALRERADRGEARRLVGARELDRRLRQRQQALDLGIGFLRERARRSPAACPRRRRSAAPAPRRAASRGRATRASAPRCAVPSSRRSRLLTTTSSTIVGQRLDRLAGQRDRWPRRP